GWKGQGVVLADHTGTAQAEHARHCVLALPLRRADLFRCLCTAAGLNTEQQSRQRPALGEAADQVGPLSILLVEDNQVNQLVASSLLRKLGHQVAHAKNGQRAIEALENKDYDRVLRDCQVPVMAGHEATRGIPQNPTWQTLP